MDVFNVTNQSGHRIMDESVLEGIKYYIYKSIGPDSCFLPSWRRAIGVEPSSDYTLIKLTGTDRPELLLKVADRKSGLAISDEERLGRKEADYGEEEAEKTTDYGNALAFGS